MDPSPNAESNSDRKEGRGNRLLEEPSLYLRQHAHNPVDWYPWGEEAWARAKAEGKPIFLSIGYASCHWCHVMAHEVFEDAEVARYANAHFICIKVDREERPDVDAVYMQAVQALTGGGGWPLSVFLTPDRKPFFGGTYFPKPRFLALMGEVVRWCGDQPDAVRKQGDALAGHLGLIAAPIRDAPISEADLNACVDRSLEACDLEWGGVRGSMKFPTPVRWSFLLHVHRRTGIAQCAGAVRATLDNMGAGGIYDHVGGGFHRYAVERTWTVPHFEKMLYDNAQLLDLYAEAYATFGEPRYATVAKETADFLLRDMRDPTGAFYGSLDADSGGEEGTFYTWTPAEMVGAVGREEGAILSDLLGVTNQGNFEGRSVLTRRARAKEVAEQHGAEPEAVVELWNAHRDTLRQHRERRTKPGLDTKIVTSWNGLAIGALARAGAVLSERTYINAAVRAADYLLAVHLTEDGSLFRTSDSGQASHQGVLDDYAFLAHGLLDLFLALGETRHLVAAIRLADAAASRFARSEGGFYLSAAEVIPGVDRGLDVFDGAEPSGNSIMLLSLLRLGILTGREDYLAQVVRGIRAFGGLLLRAGSEMAGWFDVGLRLLGPIRTAIVAGDPESSATRQLARAVRSPLSPFVLPVVIAASGPDSSIAELIPASVGKGADHEGALAFVCEHGACLRPVRTATEASAVLSQGMTPAALNV